MNDFFILKDIQGMRSIVNSDFYDAYCLLLSKNTEELTEIDNFMLLKFGLIFFNQTDTNMKKFGYSIILRFSNVFGNYIPLYELAINENYIPVSKFIEEKYYPEKFDNTFFNLLITSFEENFKSNEIYLSKGQKKIIQFSKDNDSFIIVAPTSYGKSEIIVSKVEENISKKVCIIVPTKSLLAQTRKRLYKSDLIKDSEVRIITHPDMYRSEYSNFIAVFTQERLLRILQKNENLFFDIILVDEAHNLIKNDNREILTLQDLLILKKRNPNTIFNYFTPFLAKPEDLKIISKQEQLVSKKINEFIKIERYNLYDTNSREFKQYDQFFNRFINKSILSNRNDSSFILQFKARKNIIYLNRPKDVEKFATNFETGLNIAQNENIQKVISSLADLLDRNYNLIKSIKKGVVYHHGGMPDIVRLYVEDTFSKNTSLPFLVSNSTLLEGVNIPAEKLFILTTNIGNRYFNPSQFKNLVGRVCRFSEVFNRENGSLKLLEPEIFLIKGDYSNSRTNLDTFIKKRVKEDIVILDDIDNIIVKANNENQILSEDERDELLNRIEFLENIEPQTTNETNIRYVSSDICKLCFKNNVTDFDIFENEEQLDENLLSIGEISLVSNTNELINLIVRIFISEIELNENVSGALKRLENENAQHFYSMFLNWIIEGRTYKELIFRFVSYWDSRSDNLIFVGSKWGEVKRNSEEILTKYIDLTNKTRAEKINIAIIRIKEEQNFIEHFLMKYVEILFDLGYLNTGFYEKIKYGTNDAVKIALLKEGYSLELVALIFNRYRDFITIINNEPFIGIDLLNKMAENNENDILIYELKYMIKQ